MNIRSLGRKTDLIFARFSGTVEDKGFYTLVKTPSNPGYHWGNYIIFDRPPQGGDLKTGKSYLIVNLLIIQNHTIIHLLGIVITTTVMTYKSLLIMALN